MVLNEKLHIEILEENIGEMSYDFVLGKGF
jgi:hypothetical protein